MRLQAFLARSGASPSRRKAEALISAGRVQINDRIASLGESVTPDDRVLLDGQPVELPQEHAYLALNKPNGYLTTLKDDRNRPTVVQLMPDGVPGLVPVGRLDGDTTGLLLLTNDGPFAHRVAHPSSESVSPTSKGAHGSKTVRCFPRSSPVSAERGREPPSTSPSTRAVTA